MKKQFQKNYSKSNFFLSSDKRVTVPESKSYDNILIRVCPNYKSRIRQSRWVLSYFSIKIKVNILITPFSLHDSHKCGYTAERKEDIIYKRRK